MSDSARRHQVNARLEQHAHDVVRAIAFVEGRSEAEVVRQAVEELVVRREHEEDIRDAIKIVSTRRGRKSAPA